jgi:hypothetical protein
VGFVLGQNPFSARVRGKPVLATSATAQSPAGTYPIRVISAGSLSAANHDFPSSSFGTGTLPVISRSSRNLLGPLDRASHGIRSR